MVSTGSTTRAPTTPLGITGSTGRLGGRVARRPAAADVEQRPLCRTPDWQLDAWVSTYTAIAAGELERVNDDVGTLLGRAPMSLADVLGADG